MRSACREGLYFGETFGGESYSFEQDKDPIKRLEEGLKNVGIKSEGEHDAVQRGCRWFVGGEGGAEAYTRRRQDAEKSNDAMREYCTRQLQLRHRPWASMRAGGGQGGREGGRERSSQTTDD